MTTYDIKCIIIFAVFLASLGGGTTPECDSWNNIKNRIENYFKNNAKCFIKIDCTGLHCDGKHSIYNFSVAAEINPCKHPAALDILVDIPNSKIRNLTHTLKDGDRYKLPEVNALIRFGIFIDVSLKEEPDRKLSVELEVKMENISLATFSNCTIVRAQCINSKGISKHSNQHDHDVVMPSPQIITTKKCVNCSDTEECVQIETGDSVCHCKKGYTRDEFDICNQVTLNEVGRVCDMSDLKGCDENEICKQDFLHSSNGTCQCLPNFHKNNQNHCKADDSNPKPEESHASLILAIVLPICFLILIVACMFVMVKQKVIQRVRDRFRNVTRYEVVSIGNDIDDDDDEPLVVS